MERIRKYIVQGGTTYRPHTMDSREAFRRISKSPFHYVPKNIISYAYESTSNPSGLWWRRFKRRYDEVEQELLDEGFQFIYGYDGNPKMAVRPYVCSLVENDQITGRFAYVNSGFDMFAFDDPRDAILFRMGDTHEEFLSNIPAHFGEPNIARIGSGPVDLA